MWFVMLYRRILKLEGPSESTDLCQGQQPSRLWYAKTQPQALYMFGYISNGVFVFLPWLCFVATELNFHLLDLKMYGIVKRRFPPRPNAVSYNISKNE